MLELNSLPPTAISSNPRILQTRKTIIISRRRVPRSQLDSLSSAQVLETPIDSEEAKRRQEERAVKRFQLVTKTVDPGVGKVYLSLQPPGEQNHHPHPLELGSGEKMDGKKKAQAMSQEDRAVEQWFEDDEWELQQGHKGVKGLAKKKEGKWTSVGGSPWYTGGGDGSSKSTEGIKI